METLTKKQVKKLLGTGNSKLNKTAKEFNAKIFNFSIPAGNDKITGKITCPFAGECLKLCYAKKGAYAWSNVQLALHERYTASKETDFVERIDSELIKEQNKKHGKQVYVRIHDSGDFYSPTYFAKWLEIARLNPSVRFYAYTKSHSFIRGNFNLPENFDLIFSLGSKNDELINQESERHSKIFQSMEEMTAAGYSDASYLDLNATKWVTGNNKIGLLIH
jgi:hypothetical protein